MSATAFNLMRRRQKALEEVVKEKRLEDNTNSELKKILDDKGIAHSNRASKQELIQLLGVE